MKTDYSGHDMIYKKHKAEGLPGWESSGKEYARFKIQVEKILSRGIAPSLGRLLEPGCGAGNMTVWFAEKGYECFGVDISATAIEWAKENAKKQNVKAKFAIGDVITLDMYSNDFFDFVFDGHCLHCIIGDDRRKMLLDVWRVLKTGGYLLVNSMCTPVDTHKLAEYNPKTHCTIVNGIATRYIGEPDSIMKEIEGAGFKIIRWDVESQKDESTCALCVEAVKPLHANG